MSPATSGIAVMAWATTISAPVAVAGPPHQSSAAFDAGDPSVPRMIRGMILRLLRSVVFLRFSSVRLRGICASFVWRHRLLCDALGQPGPSLGPTKTGDRVAFGQHNITTCHVDLRASLNGHDQASLRPRH